MSTEGKFYTMAETARALDPPTTVGTLRMWAGYSYIPRPRKLNGTGWLVFSEDEVSAIQAWWLGRLVHGLSRGKGAAKRMARARRLAAQQFAASWAVATR